MRAPGLRKSCFANRGFTLIELIVVLVVLSILAVMGAQFVVSSTQNYEATRTRALLVNTGRVSLERMNRQLRGALPYSVQITNGGNCVRFMPIAGGGNYTNPVPDAANGAAATAIISVLPHEQEFGDANWVSIGAMSSAEIYGANPASLAPLASRSTNSLTLGAAKQWQRNSINRRFYLLDSPQAFCVVGNDLRFYPNVDRTAATVNTNSDSDLLARQVNAPAPFTLSPASENRNTLVLINISFVSGGESISFDQQVMIRNVP